MLTYSCLFVTPQNLQSPDAVSIAVHMGRITRYGGAIWCPLIFHSLLVAGLIPDDASDSVWAAALLHDACETVSGEIPFPWKTGAQRDIEAAIAPVVFLEFNCASLSDSDIALIKQCDLAALYGEVDSLAHGPWREEWYAVYEPQAVAKGWIRPPVALIERSRQIAVILKARGFADPSRTCNPESGQVRNFTMILEAVKAGQIARARLALSAVLSKSGIERAVV